MGTCGTKLSKEEKNKLMISKQIDKRATNDFKTVDEAIKVLLLGPGESGKSTLLKQMHTLYSKGYDEEEIRSYIHIIRDNLLNSFQVCEKIATLWAEEPGLKIVYENRSMFQLPGSGDYFINQAKEIGQSGYFPNQNDILRARVRTTGIVEKEFSIGKTKFRFLYEDETIPRMKEAMDLFEEISNSRYFKNTSIVLFLNKSDLFREKIKKIPLTTMFPDYTGLQQYEEALEFIKRKFIDLNSSKGKEIYTHITCATNNDNIKHVMAAVTDVFIKQKLAKGLISKYIRSLQSGSAYPRGIPFKIFPKCVLVSKG